MNALYRCCRRRWRRAPPRLVRPVGLEPTTSSLKGSRSTIELRARGREATVSGW
jgi:hypothetical protein